jgi:hypothetical protein
MESWYFTPKVGISCSIGQINFGDSPEDVKNIIGSSCHSMTANAGGTECSLRIEYNHLNKIIYILFSNGSLIFDSVEIFCTTKPQLKKYLKSKKFVVQKPYILDGEYCPDICMEFASSKDHGGETKVIRTIGMFYSEEYWDQFK